ncbi:hypothetical protein DPMN_056907 [Dreissena polymorpha]|uniref:Uncharacterized protein n=1 Tax=Dreissena polymorpha TaxID=45954 RepID=A0A9D4CSK7_DREPO|nr:hypothetical protein DPMN_056907 [Dreissena polymorpha]
MAGCLEAYFLNQGWMVVYSARKQASMDCPNISCIPPGSQMKAGIWSLDLSP